jgi:hypothetical protein
MAIPLKTQRLINAIENGSLSGAQLDTQLQNLSIRQGFFDAFNKRGTVERLIYSSSAMNTILTSTTARSTAFADENFMQALCKSAVAMDVIVNNQTVFEALCDSSTARLAMIGNKTSRSIFFSSQFIISSFWSNSTRVNNITSLFSRLSLTTAASSSHRRLLINVDWTLIGPPFSIYGRNASTGGGYDQKTVWISPNTTIYNNANVPANYRVAQSTDVVTWQFIECTTGSDPAAALRSQGTNSGYIAIEPETNATAPVIGQIDDTPDGQTRRCFAIHDNSANTNWVRWWGLRFTRIA